MVAYAASRLLIERLPPVDRVLGLLVARDIVHLCVAG